MALARTPATDADRLAARLMPLAPVLRWLLAIVWLAGGIVPLALTPAATNIELLARSGELAARRIVNRNVVIADWLFTTPAVIVQPVTGVWLARIAGYPLTTGWLAAAIVLYLFVGACWLPVVGIQIEMRRTVDRIADGEALPARNFKLSRTWFVLGWPCLCRRARNLLADGRQAGFRLVTALFRRLLGPAIDGLASSLRTVHDSDDDRIWSGFAEICASNDPFAQVLCRMMRLPAPGSRVPVTVRFERRGNAEHWHRKFADRPYRSTLRVRHGRLVEQMGPAVNIFVVSVVDGALHMDLVGFRFLGIPLPRRARPACHAVEHERDGAFTFDIPVDLPLFGRVIHYCGRLERIDD